MSQANIGLIRRDLLQQADARALLQKIPVADLVTMAGKAADHFLNDTLPLDPESGTMQTPQQYVEQVSATTGMPFSNVRRNMAKVHGVLDKVEEVLAGLTRGLDLSVLDAGYGTVHGQMLSFFPRTDALGVVLPSNSPGVHSLWAPTPVLKMPLVLKPGSAEPWTPLRIINAWVKAGVPAGAFAYYPTDHAGGNEILRSTGRGMVFGDVGSTKRWKADGRVEVHGPGYSKVVIGPDVADEWEQFIDVIAESMSNNGGRSCVNASGVWVTKHADEIAEALAKKLATVSPRAADDPEAVLAPFADPETAKRISATIDGDMATEGTKAEGKLERAMCPRRARRRSRGVGAWRHLSAADRHSMRRQSSAGQSRIPLPVRERRRSAGVGSARLPRPVAGRDLHLERSGIPRALRRLAARRSPELRPAVDDADWVGSAARRQSLRASLRPPRDSAPRLKCITQKRAWPSRSRPMLASATSSSSCGARVTHSAQRCADQGASSPSAQRRSRTADSRVTGVAPPRARRRRSGAGRPCRPPGRRTRPSRPAGRGDLRGGTTQIDTPSPRRV